MVQLLSVVALEGIVLGSQAGEEGVAASLVSMHVDMVLSQEGPLVLAELLTHVGLVTTLHLGLRDGKHVETGGL